MRGQAAQIFSKVSPQAALTLFGNEMMRKYPPVLGLAANDTKP